jgi:hypothetical protein
MRSGFFPVLALSLTAGFLFNSLTLRDSLALEFPRADIPRLITDDIVFVLKLCSSASSSPGYVPNCSKINTSNCRTTSVGTVAPNSSGDCLPGHIKMQRFKANATRETVCVNVTSCSGAVSLCQEWNAVDKVANYKCVEHGS